MSEKKIIPIKRRYDTVILPWIDPHLLPNAARRIHWASRAKIAAQARMIARSCANEQKLVIPLAGIDLEMEIKFHPPTARHYDIDGLLSALKPSIDGLFEISQADDHQVKRVILEIGDRLAAGVIRIRITPLE